jgi:uncharacterized protein (UPF0548 family)
MDSLTYAEVGATQHRPLPQGYRHLYYRAFLGDVPIEEAGEAIMSFAMHAASEHVETSTPRAAVGTTVISLIGVRPFRLRVPCQITWVAEENDRVGFGYGTLPGHPVRGEESFEVLRDADGVWFVVTAFSRAAQWWVAALGPVRPVMQHAYARIRARALRRVLRAKGGVPS